MEQENKLTKTAQYDLKLVNAALNGDQKAFEELFLRYKDIVYFKLYRMIKNKVDAEDLMFEAFGKAFKKLEQYSSNYAFSTWLFRIANNNCIDFLRKKKNIKRTVSIDRTKDEIPINIKCDQNTPEEALYKKQKANLMREEVDKLKKQYRELIILRYFDELSYDEISGILGLPISTIKTKLYRARLMLINNIKESNSYLNQFDFLNKRRKIV